LDGKRLIGVIGDLTPLGAFVDEAILVVRLDQPFHRFNKRCAGLNVNARISRHY
jgi:hypothetical protein